MTQRTKQKDRATEEAWADLAQRAGPTVQALQQQGSAALLRILGHDDHHERDPHADRPIELCHRPAEVLGLGQVGLEHWWLRGKGFEAGMGPRGGGVPGVADVDNPTTLRTTINDHTGRGDQPGSTCQPLAEFNPRWGQVDEACVREQMTPGRDTGLWMPPGNDCHEVVSLAMRKCRVEGLEAEPPKQRAGTGRR